MSWNFPFRLPAACGRSARGTCRRCGRRFPRRPRRMGGFCLRRNGGRCRPLSETGRIGPDFRRTIRRFTPPNGPPAGADKRSSRALHNRGKRLPLCPNFRTVCPADVLLRSVRRRTERLSRRKILPLSETRTHSSVGQSSGLIIRRSWDHAPLGPRQTLPKHFGGVCFSSSVSFPRTAGTNRFSRTQTQRPPNAGPKP